MKRQSGQNIVVLGAGESGTGAAILAKQKGFDVFVSDAGTLKDRYRQDLIEHQISFEENKHSEDKILSADTIIKSPGIAEKNPLIQRIREKNIEVISEIEFAWYFNEAKIIAVSGSNGKTTTTMLIWHILKNAGFNATYGGNTGHSFARRLASDKFDHIVLELSSFQLDDMKEFRADIAVLLNITADHLDRYDYAMEKYVHSKFRLGMNQRPSDLFIYTLDDPVSREYIHRMHLHASLYAVSQTEKLERGAWLEKNMINIKLDQKDKLKIHMNILSLLGKHNMYNSMAAAVAANALDVQDESLRASLSDFESIEHRLEPVARIQNVEFINDSKATNLNATWYALESMTKDVIWIAGGIDKGNNYNEIVPLVEQKVKAIICLGKDNSKLLEAFEDKIELIFETECIKEAVKISFKLARPGEAVLLSPACASFDLFKSYEDRGTQFKEAVRSL
jgi:UDP-N-acetylmuramoylalanine--D-glutamate ligase